MGSTADGGGTGLIGAGATGIEAVGTRSRIAAKCGAVRDFGTCTTRAAGIGVRCSMDGAFVADGCTAVGNGGVAGATLGIG
jgi:hypothetical protein